MAKSLSTNPRLSLDEIINIEGVDASMSGGVTNIDAPNGVMTSVGSVLYQGDMWAYYINNIIVSSSKKCVGILIKTDRSSAGGYYSVLTSDSSSYNIDVNKISVPDASLGLKHEFRVSSIIGYASGDKLTTTIQIQAVRITNDFNILAKNSILWIGDSITYGIGASSVDSNYAFKVRNYYNSKSVRLINMSVSGTQSNNHVYNMQHGKYNMPYVNLVIISLGVNDASQGLTPSKVLSNYNLMISYFRSLNANCKFLIVAGTPVESDILYANLTSISNSLISLKNESNGIFAISCLSAFDRKNASYYTGSDTVGNRLHPNELGNYLIYDTIKSYLDTVTIL